MRAIWVIFAAQLALVGSLCPAREYSEEEIREVFKNVKAAKEGGIADVLQQMKSKNFAERETAQKSLEGMFWVSAEWLASQASKDDPELRYRLERVGKRAEQSGLEIIESIQRIGVDSFIPELFGLGASVSPNRDLWGRVWRLLGDYEGKVTDIESLKLNLKHRHPEFRRVALVLLNRSAPDIGKKSAMELLADKDESVRLEAANTLMQTGDKRGAGAAIQLLAADNDDVRWQAHSLLSALAGKILVPLEESADPEVKFKAMATWQVWLAEQPNPIPLPEGGLEEMALRLASKGVRTMKRSYEVSEDIIVQVDNFSGSETDWVTIVEKATPDSNYQQYFYGEGKKAGRFTFRGLPAGEYEVRVFHDWPAGGYEVQARSAFRVISR